MDNELSKPVAWDFPGSKEESRQLGYDFELDDEQKVNCDPLYSQEYVSSLLAEIERGNGYLDDVRYAKECCENAIAVREKRIAELEAKLATPVRLKKVDSSNVPFAGDGFNAAVDYCAKTVRAAGFIVEGD